MSTKEPELQDFGITPKDYSLYIEKDKEFPSWSTILFSPVGVFLFFFILIYLARVGDVEFVGAIVFGLFFTGLWALIGIVVLVDIAVTRFKKSRLFKSPVVSQIKLYEKARADYREMKWETERQQREAERARREAERQRQEAERQRQSKLEQYWIDMDGVEFERELGSLFQTMGYGVERTPTSGDQGVDLVLRKNGVTTVVQCKAHKDGVGPAVARELYGSMVAFRAKGAILACTGGFTRGVYEFVRGKPIRLLDASAIAKMAEGVGGVVGRLPKATRRGRQTRKEPACPKCRRQMVLRESWRGEFWGCSAYPQCRGTRNIRGY